MSPTMQGPHTDKISIGVEMAAVGAIVAVVFVGFMELKGVDVAGFLGFHAIRKFCEKFYEEHLEDYFRELEEHEKVLKQLRRICVKKKSRHYDAQDTSACAICFELLNGRVSPVPMLNVTQADLEANFAADPPGDPPTTYEANAEVLRLRVCGHTYHAKCLVGLVTRCRWRCPLCRARIYVPSLWWLGAFRWSRTYAFLEAKLKVVGEILCWGRQY